MRQPAERSDGERRLGRNRNRPVAGVLAVLVLSTLGVLAFRVTVEVSDRRAEGFCRPDHVLVGATGSEERTWWPVGDRCFLHLPDGTTRVREPGWSLTALLAGAAAVVAAGAPAPPGSARRSSAWVVAVPAVPVAILVSAMVAPASLTRLVALTAISLGFGVPMAVVTALAVWAFVRGRLLPTVLGSWLAWAVVIFLQGRDSIRP